MSKRVVDESRIPNKKLYTNDQLLGKFVKIISNASYRHYRKIGRIVGFAKNGDHVKVYIGETGSCAMFCRGSLELLNP